MKNDKRTTREKGSLDIGDFTEKLSRIIEMMKNPHAEDGIPDENGERTRKKIDEFLENNKMKELTMYGIYRKNAGQFEYMKENVTDALVHLMPEIKERYGDKFNDICIEEEFISHDLFFTGMTADTQDELFFISTAAAIALLDAINIAGNTDKATELLKNVPEEKNVLPEIRMEIMFGREMIARTVYLIRERNSDLARHEKGKTYFEKGCAERIAKKTSPEKGKNRRLFDELLSLARQDVTENAKKHFLEKIYELIDLYFRLRREAYPEELERYEKSLKIAKKLRLLEEREEKIIEEADLTKQNCMSRSVKSEAYFEMDKEICEIRKSRCTLLTDLVALMKRTLDFVEVDEALLTPGKINHNLDKTEKEIYSREIKNFSVDNPFETCLGYLLLLDSGDEHVWLQSYALGVLGAACIKLPWATDSLLEERKETNIDVIAGYSRRENVYQGNMTWQKKRTKQADAGLYERKYSGEIIENGTCFEDDTVCNIPQILYRITGMIMPRETYDMIRKDVFKFSGLENNQELFFGLCCMFPLLFTPNGRIFEKEAGKAEREEYEKKIETLSEENKSLKKTINDLLRENESAGKEKEACLLKIENDRNEIASLRKAVFELGKEREEGINDNDEEKTDIVFPVTPDRKTVVFGGHDSWRREINRLVRNVRFVSTNAKVDAGLIKNADEIWIQTNAISHMQYDRVLDITRTQNIPVRYFSSASARKCAMQLAKK